MVWYNTKLIDDRLWKMRLRKGEFCKLVGRSHQWLNKIYNRKARYIDPWAIATFSRLLNVREERLLIFDADSEPKS